MDGLVEETTLTEEIKQSNVGKNTWKTGTNQHGEFKTKNKIGRPAGYTVMTEDKLKELEGYFSIGLNDEESCLMANISRGTLFDYCKANPEYRERKEILKRKPLIKAKSNLVKELNQHNVDVSKWYAERKGKDEFSLKQEIEQKTEFTVKQLEQSSDDDLHKLIGN